MHLPAQASHAWHCLICGAWLDTLGRWQATATHECAQQCAKALRHDGIKPCTKAVKHEGAKPCAKALRD
eukprot:scaffold302711_cov21-Tisochrysis_lutea.AAC.1